MPLTSALAVDLILLASALTLAWAAVGDAMTYRIPNILPAFVAAGFLAVAWFEPPAFLTGGVLTGLGVFGLGALLFARRLMGGGDVKLLAATSLWCGPEQLTAFALVISVTAVSLALVMMSPLGRLLPAPPTRLAAGPEGFAAAARQPMPFGVAVAAGGLWLLSHYLVAPK
ncbi:MAG: cpaA [Caulobacteraceae bacterium]|nr:cpaA [Caulobacteraceae bacterium]